MHICSKCGTHYEDYGQRHSMCRECKRTYDREYHHKRSKEAKARKNKASMALKERNAKFVHAYLETHPCDRCGESDPVVLEFDHLDTSTKLGNISDMVRCGVSIDKLKQEIAKCRVLCANCHRRHTATQFGWYKFIRE